MRNVVSLNVKPTTFQTYESSIRKNIVGRICSLKVQEITPSKLDNWLRSLQQEGLSYNTLNYNHGLIHQALDYAVYPAQLITSNPASYIKVPRNAPRDIVKRYIITPEQFKGLLEKHPFGKPLHMPLMLLYHTGMRVSEVVGLTWDEIDFDTKRINLSRQILYHRKGGYHLSTLKTKTSKRYIIMDNELINELKRWKIQQEINEKTLGDSYVYTYVDEDGHITWRSKMFTPPEGNKIGIVCTRNNGLLVNKPAITCALKKEGINAHSFRHTHATQLIESGAPAKGVAGRLGHANTLITQNLYTHNTEKLQKETAAIFAQNLQTNS